MAKRRSVAATTSYPDDPLVASQKAVLFRGPMIDVLSAAKSQRRPIFIDGDLPDGIEAGLPENIPAGIAVEIAFVSGRSAFGICKPEQRVAWRLADDGGGDLIELGLRHDKDQRESQLLDRRDALPDTNLSERLQIRRK